MFVENPPSQHLHTREKNVPVVNSRRPEHYSHFPQEKIYKKGQYIFIARSRPRARGKEKRRRSRTSKHTKTRNDEDPFASPHLLELDYIRSPAVYLRFPFTLGRRDAFYQLSPPLRCVFCDSKKCYCACAKHTLDEMIGLRAGTAPDPREERP